MGGGNLEALVTEHQQGGLSPRGRGKHVAAILSGEVVRSIPAWAGETFAAARESLQEEVYPRVGGGNPPSDRRLPTAAGLSPRGRGKRLISSM